MTKLKNHMLILYMSLTRVRASTRTIALHSFTFRKQLIWSFYTLLTFLRIHKFKFNKIFIDSNFLCNNLLKRFCYVNCKKELFFLAAAYTHTQLTYSKNLLLNIYHCPRRDSNPQPQGRGYLINTPNVVELQTLLKMNACTKSNKV